MPIDAKVTYIFNAERNGWSETWYVAGASDLRAAHTAALVVAKERVNFLAPGANLEAVRTSDDRVSGDSLFDSFYPTTKGGAQSPDECTDTPWNCILVAARSQDLYRRSMYLRGASDDWIAMNPVTKVFEIEQRIKDMIDVFKVILTQQRFAIKAISKSPADAPLKSIADIDNVAGKWQIHVPGHGVTGKEKVKITKAEYGGVNNLNGVIPVKVVDADRVEVIEPAPVDLADDMRYLGKGLLQRRVTTYSIIDDLDVMRPTKRSTGRRFFVTAGRRKTSKK